jgi:hypothetical protein
MPLDAPSLVLLACSFVATFLAARWLGKGWRDKRAQKDREKRRAEALANESRQVRRARERSERRKF